MHYYEILNENSLKALQHSIEKAYKWLKNK